jgi:hypothetical protein
MPRVASGRHGSRLWWRSAAAARSTGPTALGGDARARTIRWMPRPPPAACWPATPLPCPKSREGSVGELRVLVAARRPQRDQGAHPGHQPDPCIADLRRRSAAPPVGAAAQHAPCAMPAPGLRPDGGALRVTLRSLGRRWLVLDQEITDIGSTGAGTGRPTVPCGPSPTSSSSTTRTNIDAAKRTARGSSRGEILRCRKRSIARELYPLILPRAHHRHPELT